MIDENIDLLQVKIEKAREKLPKETREAISSVNWRGIILEMKDKKGYNLEQLSQLELETELVLCGLVKPLNYQQELEMRMGINKAQSETLINEPNELIFKKTKESLIRISSKKKNVSSVEIETIVPKRDFIVNKIKQEESKILTNAGIEVLTENTEIKKETPLENREDMLAKVENPTPTPTIIPTPTTTIPRPKREEEVIPTTLVTPPAPELVTKKEPEAQKMTNSISAQKLAEPFKMSKIQTEYSLNNLTKQGDELSQKTETKKNRPLQTRSE